MILRQWLIRKNNPGYQPPTALELVGNYWALFYEHEPKVISSRETGLVHIYKLSGDERPDWTIYAVDENGSLYQKFRAARDSLENNGQPIGVIFKEVVDFKGSSARYVVTGFFSLSSAGEKADTTGRPALKN